MCCFTASLFRMYNMPDLIFIQAASLLLSLVKAALLPHTPPNLGVRHPVPSTRKRMTTTMKTKTMMTRMSPLLQNDLGKQRANASCFSEIGPLSRRLTFCQIHRWNETLGISFHLLVMWYSNLSICLSLYITDLCFYRSIYFVHTCIHARAHAHTLVLYLEEAISCVLMVLLPTNLRSGTRKGVHAGRNFTSTAFSWSSHCLKHLFTQ